MLHFIMADFNPEDYFGHPFVRLTSDIEIPVISAEEQEFTEYEEIESITHECNEL